MNQPLVPQQGSRNLAQLIANLGPQSKILETSKVDPRSLAAGIKPSFASVTFKGKTWGIRYRGVTQQLLARDQSGQVLGSIPTIDVVIVKAAMPISKTYYIEKFKEGDFAAPDCWSTNGLKPDIAAPKKQNETCRGCKWDAFGSRLMDDGRKGKACSDNKRVAVVPAADIKNEAFGGPMLLKLPPSSFAGLSELEAQLHMQGYRYDGLITRLSFDYEAAFPKIIFTPIGVLNDHQAQEIIALQDSDTVERILSEELVEVSADPNQPTAESNVVPLQKPEPQPVHTAPPSHPSVMGGGATAFNPSPPPPAAVQTPPPAGVSAAGFTAQPVQSPQVTNGAHAGTKAPEVTETPEQKIARLEAALAAASAKPATTRKRRTAPVTPAGGQPQVIVQPPPTALPGDQPIPFTAHAETGNGAAPETDEEEGDEPADLQSRIDALLKPGSAA